MTIIRRFLFLTLGIILLTSLTNHLFSQCTKVPVVESITNGNFDQGYVGFTIGDASEVYKRLDTTQFSNPGTYQVNDNDMIRNGKANSSTFNAPVFDGIYDRDFENKGVKGNMLMIDQLKKDGISWQAEVKVIPNQLYYFSAWIVELDKGREANNAQLQFEIVDQNGVAEKLGAPFKASNVWQQTFVTWESKTNSKVTLRIRNSQPEVNNGNDFALDDISFINGCNNIVAEKPDLGETQTLCTEGNVQLDAKTPGTTYNWSMVPAGQTNGIDLPEKTQKITATQPGTYQVCITSSSRPNCPITSSVEVLGTITADLGDDQVLCKPPITTLDPKVKGSKLKYQWLRAPLDKPTNFSEVEIPNDGPTINTARPGIYKVQVSSTVPGCAPVEDIVKIESNNAIPKPDSFCRGKITFKVESNGGGYKWYKTETSTQPLGTGTSITRDLDELGIGPNDQTATLYVEDTTLTPVSGAAGVDKVGGNFSSGQPDKPLKFNAAKDFILDTVRMLVRFNSEFDRDQQGTVDVYDKTGKNIGSQLVTGSNPKKPGNADVAVAVPLKVNIPKGDGFYMLLTGQDNPPYNRLNAGYYNSNASFPYKVGEVATIVEPRPNDRNYWFFFNWNVSVPPGCGRVPVTNIKACPPCEAPNKLVMTTSGSTEQCAPTAGDIELRAEPSPAGPPSPDNYIIVWFKDGVKMAETTTKISAPLPQPFGNAKYTVRVAHKDTTNDLCYAEVDTVLRVSEQLTPGTLIIDTSICAGASVLKESLTPATGGGPSRVYEWLSSASASGPWSPVTPAAKAENLSTGPLNVTTYYRRRVFDPKCGADTTDVAAIKVNQISMPEVKLQDRITDICELEPHTFKADSSGAGAAGTFFWTYNNTEIKGTNEFTINANQWGSGATGQLTVRLQPGKDYACYGPDALDADTFNIIHAIEPKITWDPLLTLCEGTEMNFKANTAPAFNTGDKFTWKLNSATVQSDILTYSTSTLKNGDIIEVSFTSSSKCATKPDAVPVSKTFIVYERPEALIAGGDTVCKGNIVTLSGTGNFTTTNLDTTFQWLNQGQPISGANTSEFSTENNGDLSLVITNGVCPPDTSNLEIVRIEFPDVEAGPTLNRMSTDPPTVIQGTLKTDNAYSGIQSIVWTPEDSGFTKNTDEVRPSVVPQKPTWYSVVVTTNRGCPDSSKVLVNVYMPIRIPNAFSPNDDALNEKWTIDGLETYPDAEVKVYNRWGNIVFKSKGYQSYQQWDGTIHGNPVPVATYYYVIDPKVDIAGGVQTGWVVIIR